MLRLTKIKPKILYFFNKKRKKENIIHIKNIQILNIYGIAIATKGIA
jgi:hypothetical protein